MGSLQQGVDLLPTMGSLHKANAAISDRDVRFLPERVGGR